MTGKPPAFPLTVRVLDKVIVVVFPGVPLNTEAALGFLTKDLFIGPHQCIGGLDVRDGNVLDGFVFKFLNVRKLLHVRTFLVKVLELGNLNGDFFYGDGVQFFRTGIAGEDFVIFHTLPFHNAGINLVEENGVVEDGERSAEVRVDILQQVISGGGTFECLDGGEVIGFYEFKYFFPFRDVPVLLHKGVEAAPVNHVGLKVHHIPGGIIVLLEIVGYCHNAVAGEFLDECSEWAARRHHSERVNQDPAL